MHGNSLVTKGWFMRATQPQMQAQMHAIQTNATKERHACVIQLLWARMVRALGTSIRDPYLNMRFTSLVHTGNANSSATVTKFTCELTQWNCRRKCRCKHKEWKYICFPCICIAFVYTWICYRCACISATRVNQSYVACQAHAELTSVSVYRDSGFAIKTYRYYDPSTCGFDFNGCLEDLSVSSWVNIYLHTKLSRQRNKGKHFFLSDRAKGTRLLPPCAKRPPVPRVLPVCTEMHPVRHYNRDNKITLIQRWNNVTPGNLMFVRRCWLKMPIGSTLLSRRGNNIEV